MITTLCDRLGTLCVTWLRQMLERQQTLFGTADLAFPLVHTSPARQEELIAFGTALQQRLAVTSLIRSVAFGSSLALLAALDHVTLD